MLIESLDYKRWINLVTEELARSYNAKIERMFVQLLLLLLLLRVLSPENFCSSLPYGVMAGIGPGSITMICLSLFDDKNKRKDFTEDGGEEILRRCFTLKVRLRGEWLSCLSSFRQVNEVKLGPMRSNSEWVTSEA